MKEFLFLAEIELFETRNGGRSRPVGGNFEYRPHVVFSDESNSICALSFPVGDEIHPGEKKIVKALVLFPEQVEGFLVKGEEFLIVEVELPVGKGKILDLIE